MYRHCMINFIQTNIHAHGAQCMRNIYNENKRNFCSFHSFSVTYIRAQITSETPTKYIGTFPRILQPNVANKNVVNQKYRKTNVFQEKYFRRANYFQSDVLFKTL